jgi:hemolysin III
LETEYSEREVSLSNTFHFQHKKYFLNWKELALLVSLQVIMLTARNKLRRYARGGIKPVFRGLSHEIALFTIPIYAYALLSVANDITSCYASLCFILCMTFCFGVSSQYHRRNWSWSQEEFLQKLDHIGIYFMIAGSYTPAAAMILSFKSGLFCLFILWSICFLGIIHTLSNEISSTRLIIYLLMGGVMVPFIPQLFNFLSWFECFCMLAVWIQYGLGMLVYKYQWFDLYPNKFGFHEVFHALVIGAAICTSYNNYAIVLKYTDSLQY